MIARIFDASASFLRVCQYVCEDQRRSLVLDQEGVRGLDPLRMARDFEIIHGLRPGREKPVFHGLLDFHPNEKIDDARMVEIARKYLVEIGRTDTQYAIVKHFDKRHLHVHIVANRVDFGGEYITGYPERLKSKDAAERLIREYGLIPVGEKNLRLTNLEALDRSETRLYTIYRSIKECLPGCQSLEMLGERLSKRGIDTRYRYDEQTGEKQGISFRYEKEAFKGSRVDRSCSLGRLENTLAQQQELALWEKQKLTQLEKEKLAQQEERRTAQRQQPPKDLPEEEEQGLRQRLKQGLSEDWQRQQEEESLRERDLRQRGEHNIPDDHDHDDDDDYHHHRHRPRLY